MLGKQVNVRERVSNSQQCLSPMSSSAPWPLEGPLEGVTSLGLNCPAQLPLYETLPPAHPDPHGNARAPTLFSVPGVTEDRIWRVSPLAQPTGPFSVLLSLHPPPQGHELREELPPPHICTPSPQDSASPQLTAYGVRRTPEHLPGPQPPPYALS